jgi:polysaccharide pyruvyl transferase WcaK-like protein
MLLARLFGLKVLHAFTSVGPLEQEQSRRIAGWGLNVCDFIIVRDEKSATEVEKLTGVRPLVAADAVWLLPPLGLARLPNPMLGEGGMLWKVGLSLRPHGRFSLADEQALVHHLSDVLERATQGLQVEVSLISCEDVMDIPLLERVEEQLRMSLSGSAREKTAFKLVPQSSAWATLAEMHWVVGMRYHALVSALLNNVPVYALDYDPKVEMLAKDLHLPSTPVDALIGASSHDFLQGLEAYQVPDLTPLIQTVESAFSALRIVLESEHQPR